MPQPGLTLSESEALDIYVGCIFICTDRNNKHRFEVSIYELGIFERFTVLIMFYLVFSETAVLFSTVPWSWRTDDEAVLIRGSISLKKNSTERNHDGSCALLQRITITIILIEIASISREYHGFVYILRPTNHSPPI